MTRVIIAGIFLILVGVGLFVVAGLMALQEKRATVPLNEIVRIDCEGREVVLNNNLEVNEVKKINISGDKAEIAWCPFGGTDIFFLFVVGMLFVCGGVAILWFIR